MFDVLMYLFETYIHNEPEMRVDQDQLTDDLAQAGFHRDDIYNALNWLEKLADLQEGQMRLTLWMPIRWQCGSTPKRKARVWTPAAVVFSCSWNRFRY